MLFIATAAAFSISRLKVPGGRTVMNLALFTYFIPAAFLAVPMYRTMGTYGLLNNHWALILAMVTIASPYAIWVLKQASDKLPVELDEAAIMDGATTLQIFRLVYVPLMMPSLVAIGTYAVLLAWNEYLYAFLLLSNDRDITLPVALGNFLAADDSPWELLMTTGFIYALPPAAIYYAFKRYMGGGLTAGAVKPLCWRGSRRVGKANGSRERAPDARLRMPTTQRRDRIKVGTARRAPLPTLQIAGAALTAGSPSSGIFGLVGDARYQERRGRPESGEPSEERRVAFRACELPGQ